MNISENVKQLIIRGISNVQKLSQRELRACEKRFIFDGQKELIEEEDFRISFIQAIENLSGILYPYFDERMQNYYSKNIIYLSGWHSEILKKCEDNHFKEFYNDAPKKSEQGELCKLDVMLSLQIKMAKLLFNEVMIFIQRNNLLKDSPNKNEVKKHEQ